MQLNLEGKTALITGSSKGIGLAIAKKLLDEGCKVALNGRHLESLEKAEIELGNSNITKIVGDVSSPSEAKKIVERAVEALGGCLDILVCNVGSGRSVAPGSESFNEWQQVFANNLWSTTNMVEAAKNYLQESKGSIVCVSSICGIEVIPNAPVTYSVAKAALNSYVRGISRPLGKQKVRINAIAPGNILFEGSVWEQKLLDNPQTVSSMIDKEVALSAFGSAQDVADWVAWLSSPRCNFVTGGVYVVDGGQIRS
jgi:NAD(P)-dependent dehydrogenase (short-subunit alcohol dehydrogenase family)